MNWLRSSTSRYKMDLNFNNRFDWHDYRDLDYGYYDYDYYPDDFKDTRQLCRSLISCRTLRPSCRTLRPTCRTLRPTCSTLRPTCRTLRPSCRTLRPTCRTLRPPTCRAFRPGCRVLRPPSCNTFAVQTPPPGQPGPTQPDTNQPQPTQPAPQPPTQPQCPYLNPPPACNYVYVSTNSNHDLYGYGYEELDFSYFDNIYGEDDNGVWWIYHGYTW